MWQEKAVFEALSENWIAGAAADVVQEEPTAHDNPLLSWENFIGKPHVAAHTQNTMQRMAMVVEDIVGVIRGRRMSILQTSRNLPGRRCK